MRISDWSSDVCSSDLAAIRAVAAVWLPHLGAGLTRQHEQSVAVAAAALGILGVRGWRRARHRTRTTSESLPVLKAGGGGGCRPPAALVRRGGGRNLLLLTVQPAPRARLHPTHLCHPRTPPKAARPP